MLASSFLVAVKSTLLLAAGMLCLRRMRTADAAVRHLVCVFSLAGAAVSPFLALWTPR
jgi:hypothetical protein